MVDDDGFFEIVDRLKELIKYKCGIAGRTRGDHPPEVADVLAVQIGPNKEAGELPKAFIMHRDDLDSDR